MRHADYLVALLGDDVGAFNDGDKVLRVSDLALEALPYLVAGKGWGCSRGIDGLGVCAVDCDHLVGICDVDRVRYVVE